jgi:hypothetical protein
VGGLQRTRKRQNGREALRTAACPPKQPRFHAEIDGRGDELQARIDPAAVRIVQHLDAWRERVEKCLPVNGKIFADMLEPSQKGLEPLRRQALIWRQLLSGDKEPEAYMDRGERTRLRGTLARRIWDDYRRRHWKRVLLVACAVAVAAVFFVWLVSWYGDHKALEP